MKYIVVLITAAVFLSGCAGQETKPKNHQAYLQAQQAYRNKNFDVARVFAKQAAQQDDADAQYLLGYMMFNGIGGESQPLDAVVWFQRAYAKEHAKAAQALDDAYANIESAFAAKRYDVVKILATKAASKGEAKAQYLLGYLYFYGLGVDKDPAQAKEWFQLSANRGYAKAQKALENF